MSPELALLIAAMIRVESAGNDAAIGMAGEVGCLQISAVVIDDVNRIAGHMKFSLADRFHRDRSIAIFRDYVDHYATRERLGREPTLQDIARIWNGGPAGHHKTATLPYWWDVRRELTRASDHGGAAAKPTHNGSNPESNQTEPPAPPTNPAG